jgi:hypothetical protein
MQTTVQTPNAPTTPEVKVVVIRPGQFAGALSRFQVSAFGDLFHGGFSKQVSHKIASDFGSDLGRLMSTDSEFASKIGKANKDGESRIKLSGGGKIKSSYAMSIIRTCQVVDGLYMEGLIESRKVPIMTEKLADYVKDCETWAAGQTWEQK